ncbi:MAG: NAD(P)H-dependent oxidoreductase [Mucilaginibacter sp.]|uniref:NAD(P)H-dependent oxidoreductase n=1 Tax=Mucilaginibacter sp. TaxID=1882438 RepID=UPI0031A8229A
MELQELLKWRYATKAMNGQKVDKEKVERILEAIRFAPSSNGVQPYELIVVTNPELRAKLRPVCNNQSVVTDSSHLVVFAAWENITEEHINNVLNDVLDERGNYPGVDDFRAYLLQTYRSQSTDQNFIHAARQAYIGLGFGLLAGANEGVDTTPMEGFDPAAVDEVLGLREKGLKSVLMMAIGYRDVEKDWLVNMKKVRRPNASFITELY